MSLMIWQVLEDLKHASDNEQGNDVTLLIWGKSQWGFEFEASQLRSMGRGQSLPPVKYHNSAIARGHVCPNALLLCRWPVKEPYENTISFLPSIPRFYVCDVLHNRPNMPCMFMKLSSKAFLPIVEHFVCNEPQESELSNYCYTVQIKFDIDAQSET